MILCDKCGHGWHLSCMVPRMTSVPKGTWHCPNCVCPCESCGEVDIYDDCSKRLLSCAECGDTHHMHCLDPPVALEPDGDWTCRTCNPPKPSRNVCQSCHQELSTRSTRAVRQCVLCQDYWHTKCLPKHCRKQLSAARWHCEHCQEFCHEEDSDENENADE